MTTPLQHAMSAMRGPFLATILVFVTLVSWTAQVPHAHAALHEPPVDSAGAPIVASPASAPSTASAGFSELPDGKSETSDTLGNALNNQPNDGPDNAPAARTSGPIPCEDIPRDHPLYIASQTLLGTIATAARIDGCATISGLGGGAEMTATLATEAPQPVIDVLVGLAASGLLVELRAVARDTLTLRIRDGERGSRGVQIVGLDTIELTFADGIESAQRLELAQVLEGPPGVLIPAVAATRLERLGYRLSMRVTGPATLELLVARGRLIRRVRVRGALPLSERDLRRVLSVDTRPGKLSRGTCVQPKAARDKALVSTCDAGDLSCQQWETRERDRLRRHLFDQGYLRGDARLLLVCGSDPHEADLHVLVEKGRPLYFRPREMSVMGLQDRLDARWIKRAYTPRVLGFIPKRVTREFMMEAQQRVESTFSSPTTYGRLVRASSQSVYPKVESSSSFDRYDPEEPSSIPTKRRPPLNIEVRLGRPLEVSYARKQPDPGAAMGDAAQELAFSTGTLDDHLTVFETGEQVGPQTARRDAANLRSFYQSRGYPLATISGTYRQGLDEDELSFTIDEGPRGRIRQSNLVTTKTIPPVVLANVESRWRDAARLRRGGTFSEQNAVDDIKNILGSLADAGYLCARATVKLAFWESGLDKGGERASLDLNDLLQGGGDPAWSGQFSPAGLEAIRAEQRVDLFLRIEIRPGPRVLTARSEDIQYLETPLPRDRQLRGIPRSEDGNWGAPRIFESTPLRGGRRDGPGDVPLSPKVDTLAQEAIINKYRNNGYPFADAELSWRYRTEDRVVELGGPQEVAERGICRENSRALTVKLEPSLAVFEGPQAVFGRTEFRGNFKTRDWVLRRELKYEEGDRYEQSRVDSSLGSMQETGTISGGTVTSYDVGCQAEDEVTAKGAPRCTINQIVSVEEAKDITADLRLGFGAQTLNPLYVFIRPSFPNVFGTAVDIEAEALWGFPLSNLLSATDLCGGFECFERHASATFIRNHIFGTRANLEITGQFSRRVTPARGRVDAAFGQLRFTWRVGERANMYSGYLIQLANLSKDSVRPLGGGAGEVISRRDAIVSDRTGALEAGYAWTNTDNPFNPNKGIIASVALRLASPLLAGQDWWFSHELTFQQFVPIPRTADRLNFRYSLRYGQAFPFKGPFADTTTVPEVWRFYGGGTADLGLRGILPETMYVDVEEIPTAAGGTVYRPRAIGGHIRAIGTLALQVTSVKDFLGGRLAHSLFYDFGVIGQQWDQISFLRDYRQSVGVNVLKWDVDVVTLALGYAILVPTRDNVRITDDANGRVVFDVGVTF